MNSLPSLSSNITLPMARSRSFLPEDIQSALIYWRDQFREGYFNIGDIAAGVIEAFGRAGTPIPQAEVFAEIGRFCGKSARTVRYYYETALFYPPEIRARYSQLSFSHFVVARAFGDESLSVLEFAALEPVLSSDALRERFMAAATALPESVAEAHAESDLPVLEGQLADNPAEDSSAERLRRHAWLSNIDKLASSAAFFEEQLEELDMSREPLVTQELQALLKAIYNILPDLTRLIDYPAQV